MLITTNLTVVTLLMVVLEKLQILDATTLFVAVIIGVVSMVERTGVIISGANCRIHIRLEWW
ncbi:hypothetical protein [Fervidibacter sacchari]